jgi:hypothetical protein
MSPPEGHVTLQLLVALEDVHPTVWRRLLVPGGVRLPKFHLMLQAGMGWSDSHLHQFRIGGVLWGMHFEDWVDDELDEATVTVARAVGATRQFFYDYDFGDGWGLEMAVESTWRTPQPLKHAVRRPARGRGRGARVRGLPADPRRSVGRRVRALSVLVGGRLRPRVVRSGREEHCSAEDRNTLTGQARRRRCWSSVISDDFDALRTPVGFIFRPSVLSWTNSSSSRFLLPND